MDLEFQCNDERFSSRKWGSHDFDNMHVVPPGSTIVRQMNLEYLGRVVFNTDGMIGGLRVVGIEAKATMFGQPMAWFCPVLLASSCLKSCKTVSQLLIWCEGFGATMGFFPVDHVALQYLKLTVRSDETEIPNNPTPYFLSPVNYTHLAFHFLPLSPTFRPYQVNIVFSYSSSTDTSCISFDHRPYHLPSSSNNFPSIIYRITEHFLLTTQPAAHSDRDKQFPCCTNRVSLIRFKTTFVLQAPTQ
ncbi:unnamed protein product [Lactuca virosa]|uniref:Uncharacterized protein n=1 Tax=Lactuca virosa TaxID=75947 RepID=A0AAU9N5L9_9ASTR|nr:unnamed protein product [Lactuca virosa]